MAAAAATMVSSVGGLLAMLNESHPALKLHSLSNLNALVDYFWPEISTSIPIIESLYEDEYYDQRPLAALLLSKVFYYLGELNDSLSYALGAGPLFDVSEDSDYVHTLLAKSIDEYANLKTKAAEANDDSAVIDPRLEAIVEKMLDKCIVDGKYQQAIGMAIECRRLDKLEEAILRSENVHSTINYCIDVSHSFVNRREYRLEVDSNTEKKAEPEPTFEILTNPARVIPSKEKFIKFLEGSRYLTVKTTPSDSRYILLQAKMGPFATFPKDMLLEILLRTSPLDASRFAAISKWFKSAAEEDYVWEKFLPSDWKDIVSISVPPVVYATMKELYFSLCHSPISFYDGRLTVSLEKKSGKKCYMIGARGLEIVWSNVTPWFWKWTSDPHSRFGEVAELQRICMFDIKGVMDVAILSRNIIYGAYLVFKLAEKCKGMESANAVVRFMNDEEESEAEARATVVYLHPGNTSNRSPQRTGQVAVSKSDGWKEVELGSFCSGGGDEGGVVARIMEIKNRHWKYGLIVDGIDFRPKP